MHYWNKANFEGLKEVGEAIASEPALEGFSQYCLLREQGLRKPALQALDRFLNKAKAWESDEQRRFADWVCRTNTARSEVHQLIAAPLQEWLLAVLKGWADAGNDSAPLRWMGTLTGDVVAFEGALQRDPSDELSRTRLILSHADDLDFAAHHLPDYFIGEPEEVLERTAVAQELIDGFAKRDQHQWVADEYGLARQKVLDWQGYQAADTELSFDEWCQTNHGRTWGRITTVYYGAGDAEE